MCLFPWGYQAQLEGWPEQNRASANPQTMGPFLWLSHEQRCVTAIVPPSRDGEARVLTDQLFSVTHSDQLTKILKRKKERKEKEETLPNLI